MIRLEMKNYIMISTEKHLKYQLYHQVVFINMNILLVKIILPSNQQQIIEQPKFTYSPLGKALEKQIKTIEDQGKKQVEAFNTLKSNEQLTIEDVIPNDALNNDEAKKELDKIEEIEKSVGREELTYETDEYTYSFKNFQTIKTFGRHIYEGKITIKEADEYHTDLLTEITNFRKNTKPRSQEEKQEK